MCIIGCKYYCCFLKIFNLIVLGLDKIDAVSLESKMEIHLKIFSKILE